MVRCKVGIVRYTTLVVWLSACVHAPPAPPAYLNFSVRHGPFAIQHELSEIDTLRVGDYPKSVSLSPSQEIAYVCNLEQGSVDIFNTNNGQKKKRIRFHRTPLEVRLHGQGIPSFEEKPVEIGFTGNGRYVWISLLNSGGVVVYDTEEATLPEDVPSKTVDMLDAHNKTLRTLKLRFIATGKQPKIIAALPHENKVFVANWQGYSVSVIDADNFKKIKNIEVGSLPRGICFTASSAFIANFGSRSISEINLNTLRVRRTIKNVGENPRHLITAPNGKSIYVSNHGDAFIRQIDSVTGHVLRAVHVGREPRTIALSRNKNFLFVANYGDDTLAVIDLRTMAQTTVISTVRRPIGISVDTRSDTVWVTGYWEKAVRRYQFDSKLGVVKDSA